MAKSQSLLYDKQQYLIVYITSSTNISPTLFEDSFEEFSKSFKSIIYETLPTISTSFNITTMDIWCLNDNIIDFDEIYASFYLNIKYNSNKNGNNNFIMSSIMNRINNDLLSLLINDRMENTLINFETFDQISAKNISFIINEEIDCIEYLMEIQQKRTSTTTTKNNNYLSSNTHDDIFQIERGMFIGYTIICIVIGIIYCTFIVFCHIRCKQYQRRLKRRKLKKERKMINKIKRTRSKSTSHHHNHRVVTMIQNDEEHDDEDNDTITIFRPSSAKTDITDIPSCTDNLRNIQIKRRSMSHMNHTVPIQKIKSHSMTIDSIQSELIQQQYRNRKRNKSAMSAASYSSKIKRGYDQLGQFDEEDIELKQEELQSLNENINAINDNNNNNNNHHMITRRVPLDEIDIDIDNNNNNNNMIKSNDNSPHGSLETAVTNTEKVVTVHVHHHYNPNPNPSHEVDVVPSSVNSIMHLKHQHPLHQVDNDENYPDLPNEHNLYKYKSNLIIPPRSSVVDNDNENNNKINNILSISLQNKAEQKEPSKSQREGFSSNTKPQIIEIDQKEIERKNKKEEKKIKVNERRSIGSQQDDNHSDSSGMYEPGPAAADDDTPGIHNHQTPIIEALQTEIN